MLSCYVMYIDCTMKLVILHFIRLDESSFTNSAIIAYAVHVCVVMSLIRTHVEEKLISEVS